MAKLQPNTSEPTGGARAKFLRPWSARAFALDLSRRARHVEGLLRNMGLDHRQAGSWALAFADESDPLMVLPEWLGAGWRDPLVVQACLRIFGTREAAEAALDALDWELSRPWDSTVPDALLEVGRHL